MSTAMEDLKTVRDTTKAGVLACTSALRDTGGDVDKAIDLLRKQGLTDAEKRSDRETNEGRVGTYVHSNGRVGAIVALTCETDFVAKTNEFQDLLKDLCLQVAGGEPEVVDRSDIPETERLAEAAKYTDTLEGKPENIQEKILEGKMVKNFYAQRCLMDQEFINEAKFKGSVRNLVKGAAAKLKENIQVKGFTRVEL